MTCARLGGEPLVWEEEKDEEDEEEEEEEEEEVEVGEGMKAGMEWDTKWGKWSSLSPLKIQKHFSPHFEMEKVTCQI